MAGIRNIILILVYRNVYTTFGLRTITENSTQILNRLKRDSPCIPDAIINNCLLDFPMYIMMPYQFTATVFPGCSDSSLYYQWEANSLESDDGIPIHSTDEIFIIPEFSFINGMHEIIVKITEFNDPYSATESFRCYIDIELEDPIPIISGGTERTLIPNVDYIVDASSSINFRFEEIEPVWSVDCIEHESSCTAPEGFTCPEPNYRSGLRWSFNTQSCYDYKITLSLHQIYSDSTASFEQTLHVIMDEDVETSHFEYACVNASSQLSHMSCCRCISNCNNTKYLQTRTQAAAVFKVVCDYNCKTPAPKYSFKYEDNGQVRTIQPDKNFETNRLVEIKKDSLESGKKYYLFGDQNDRSTKKENIKLILETYKDINIACTITPKEGIALETIFKFDCTETTPKEYTFIFNIYQPNENGLFAMQSSYPVFETQLGVSRRILIGATYGQSSYTKMKKIKDINVVAKKIDKDESLKSLKMIIQSKKPFEICQLAHLILTEVSKNMEEKEKFQVQSLVLEELIKVPINNPLDYLTMGLMANILMQKPFTIAYAKRLKYFCYKISKSSTVVKFDARFQDIKRADKQLRSIAKCIGTNFESEATLSSDNDVTTPSEGILMEDEVVMTENYPNYDDEVASDIEQQVEDEAHEKVMQNAFETAKNLKVGDEVKKIIGVTSLKIYKDNHKAHLDREHKFRNGSFVYLEGFPEAESIVSMYKEIESTSYITQDPSISTTVVEIATAKVGHDNQMEYISTPLYITFDKLVTPFIKEIQASITLPSNPNDWNHDLLTNNISVHRLNVFEGHAVFIEFLQLSKDLKLKVAITQNIRPNISHFTNGYIVDESDENSWNIYPKIDTSEGNCWIYMAVLIHEDMLRNEKNNSVVTVEYLVKFSSKSCVVWNTLYREWTSGACELNVSSESVINCKCKHSSIFAGIFTNVDSKLDYIILMKDELELTTCYIVYCFLASIVALYCIAMCFSLKRNAIKDCRDNVFYLADNFKNDLYCYIIIVKTGNVKNAGTTSNIMIQLHGTKHDSDEHVLNYPDPDKQLLQRDSEQWFVLTVDQYLGEVNAIDIWFDSIGYRPNWYCDSIHVLDLQKHETYYFDIKLWLDVLIDCTNLTVKSTNENLFEDWNKKLFSNFKFHIGGNHTWNIFTRSHDAELSYIQRITCILSQILNIYVLAVFMYGSPELKMRDGLSVGLFTQVTIGAIGFFSGFISFMINIIIIVMFRHSSNGYISIYNFVIEQKLLPPWTNTLAWGLLFANIHLSIIYLLTFGFWLPIEESIQWVVSTSFGVLANIFVFESLFLSCEEIFLKYYSRTHNLYEKQYQFDNIMSEVESQRRFLYNRFGEFLLRPYLRHLYKNLTDEVVVSKKIWNTLKLNVSSLFKDFVLFLLYFILIYLLVFSERMSVLYDSNQRMGRIVSEGLGHDWFDLESIENYKDIYDYIEYTLIPALNGQFWYGEWEVRNAGTMVEIANKIIGVAQVRQQRHDFGPCENLAVSCCNMSQLLCHNFISASKHSGIGAFHKSMWTYKSSRETGLPSFTGVFQSYDGGGFIARLGRNKQNSLYILEYLKKRHWIDISTKVVFIDFWTYNANYNLFNVVQIVIERSPTAFMSKYYKVFTGHLLIAQNIYTELFRNIVVLLLLCIMIASFIRHIENIIKLKRKYFKIFWNYYDWIMLVTTLFTLIWFIQRNNMAERVIEKIGKSDNNDFVLYFHLVQTSESLVLLYSLLVCLATLRIWKYLRFFRIFKTFEKTIAHAAAPLLLNLGYLLLIMFAYSSMGFLIFGAIHPDMNSFIKITVTLFITALGFPQIDSEPEILDTYLGYLGQIYKTSFLIISLLMVNIITTIIIIYLDDSKQCLSNIRDPYTIFDYVKEEYRYYKELMLKRSINLRLRGGADNTAEEQSLHDPWVLNSDEVLVHRAEKVYAKSLEHRYADSEKVATSRMNSMAIITSAVIRRRLLRRGLKINRKDYKTMAGVVLNLNKTSVETSDNRKDKELIFFTQNISRDHVGIVNDYRLVNMEYVVKKLVSDGVVEKEERVVYKAEADAHKFVNIYNNLKSLLDCLKSIKFVK